MYQYDFLKKIGKVHFFRLDTRKYESPVVGFIECEDVSVADELISKGYIEIEDKRLQIKSFNEYKRRFRRMTVYVKYLKKNYIFRHLIQL